MKKIIALILTVSSLLAFGCGSSTAPSPSKESVLKLTELNLTYVKSP